MSTKPDAIRIAGAAETEAEAVQILAAHGWDEASAREAAGIMFTNNGGDVRVLEPGERQPE